MPQVQCNVHKSHTAGSCPQTNSGRSFTSSLMRCRVNVAKAKWVRVRSTCDFTPHAGKFRIPYISFSCPSSYKNAIWKLKDMPLGSRTRISHSFRLLYYAWDDRGSIPGRDKSTLALRPTNRFILLVLGLFPKAVRASSCPLTIVTHI